MEKSKAVVLLSGGLDSALAASLVQEQGIRLTAVQFLIPFSPSDRFGQLLAERLKIPYRLFTLGADYLKIIQCPRFGYGSGLNPCLDCRIHLLQKAYLYAQEIGAGFLVTGEVLGQRPMSQHLSGLRLVEEKSGLTGKILRPLSAKLLPPTEAEEAGWIDREKFLAIEGRSRKEQLRLAAEREITEYRPPAGGCLLTDRQFSARLADLFQHKKDICWSDVNLLTKGRHFRSGGSKLVIGRDEKENNALQEEGGDTDIFLEVEGCGSPVALLQGVKTKEALRWAAALTARYADTNEEMALVRYNLKNGEPRYIRVKPATSAEVEGYRLTGAEKKWKEFVNQRKA